MNPIIFYSLLMLFAGIGIPIMATLNSRLGAQLSNPALATVILFAVGLIVSSGYLLKVEGMPKDIVKPDIAWYFYTGGLFVVFYILSITWVSPRFGVGNAVSFVLLGQLIAMTIIDHFGLFGTLQVNADIKRIAGLVLMAAGVFLVVKRV